MNTDILSSTATALLHQAVASTTKNEAKQSYYQSKYVVIEGLHAKLTDDFYIETTKEDTLFLELSFMLQGEQLIRFSDPNRADLSIGSMQYAVVSNNPQKRIEYYVKNQNIQELKIGFKKAFLSCFSLEQIDQLKRMCYLVENNMPMPFRVSASMVPKLQRLMTIVQHPIDLSLVCEIQSILYTILHIISKNIMRFKQRQNHYIEQFYEVERIILRDLSSVPSLKALAKQIKIPVYVIQKEFKTVFGCTIFEYAMELRIERAKHLLQNTSITICDISKEIGYKNATHFSAAFKKITGKTPTRYRLGYQHR